MKKKGWQTWLAAGILFVQILTIFLPGFSINADRYIDAALKANQYAVDEGSKQDKAEKVTEKYKDGTDEREDAARSFNNSFDEQSDNNTSLTRLFFAKWLIRKSEDPQFEQVNYKEGKTFEDTDITMPLRLWGWLIYIPFLFALLSLVFVLCKRRPLSGLLLADGCLTIFCEVIAHLVIPGWIWSEAESVVSSFKMVGTKALEVDGVGKKFVTTLLSKCCGIWWILIILLAVILIIYAILLLVMGMGKQKEEDYDDEFTDGQWDAQGTRTEIQVQRTDIGPLHSKTGKIHFIQGQYAGSEITIGFGEEIVLGRDPKSCMLIFNSQSISRKHCGIRYDVARGRYLVIDYSSSGTRLSDGTVLKRSSYTPVMRGVVVSLAGGRERFMLM